MNRGERRHAVCGRNFGWQAVGCLLLGWVAVVAEGQQTARKAISVGEPPADHSWQAELASFQVLEGFEVSLFADESDGVANPIAIRWDEKGRLWCVQTTSYPQAEPGKVTDDKVIVLEDTDGDGRADRRTVFADGLEQPMGLELAPRSARGVSPNGHSVYVGEGTKLWLMTDTDGDDVADVREVVFSGFGTGDTHQNINSFIWAPDGSLVMHQGLHCYSKVATPWGTKTLYGAGFWRYWPRSARLEAYPTGMPLNPWGTVFDAAGQPYLIAGAAGMFWPRPLEVSTADTMASDSAAQREDRQIHGIPHFLISRQQLPYSGQIIKTDGLRKFCGIDMPGHAHWPKEMQGELVTGGFFENAIYRHKLVPDGEFPSGKKAIEQEPLITSDNVAFRPVDVRFGPDGALYIADWYNPIIGHYQASFRHPNRDKSHGRIWRVRSKEGATQDSRLKIAAGGGDRWADYQVWRLLNEGTKEQALGEVKTDLERLRVMEMFEQPDAGLVEKVMQSAVAEERAYGVHALGNWAHRLPADEVLKALEQRAGDESGLVRVEVVVAAAKVRDGRALRVALKVLEKPMDSFIERALWLACHATARDWKTDVPALVAGLSGAQLAFLLEKEGSVELLDGVRSLAVKAEVDTGLKRAIHVALARRGGVEDWTRALEAGGADAVLLAELAQVAVERGGKGPEGAGGRVAGMLKRVETKVAALRLAGAWRLGGLKERVVAEGKTEVLEVRQAALWALGRLGGEAAVFEAVMKAGSEPFEMKVVAVEVLAERAPKVAGVGVAALLGGVVDFERMKRLLAPVLARPAAVAALAEALKASPCGVDPAKLALRVLTSTGQSAPELSAVLYGVMGSGGGLQAYDPKWVTALAGEVKAQGDAGLGKAVFQSTATNCAACHQIAGVGGIIGPELDAVGRGVPVELLIEAIVWPNRQIKEGYVATTLMLKDGRTLQGYKIAESAAELQLKDMLNGRIHKLSPAQIANKLEAGSLMPEGLTMAMTRAELVNLVAYLLTLGR
jgi:putative membrane-bound dehydrogenase-like protein